MKIYQFNVDETHCTSQCFVVAENFQQAFAIAGESNPNATEIEWDDTHDIETGTVFSVTTDQGAF